jgi:hypothetical protein
MNEDDWSFGAFAFVADAEQPIADAETPHGGDRTTRSRFRRRSEKANWEQAAGNRQLGISESDEATERKNKASELKKQTAASKKKASELKKQTAASKKQASDSKSRPQPRRSRQES